MCNWWSISLIFPESERQIQNGEIDSINFVGSLSPCPILQAFVRIKVT